MSTISAGLVNTTNLTVTGTQSGAVNATNFNTQNVNTVNVNASGKLSAGAYEFNAPISNNYKTKINSFGNSNCWDASRNGVVGSGPTSILPFGTKLYTPTISSYMLKNGDVSTQSAGIARWDNLSLKPNDNSLYPLYSQTKTVTAVLYARFKTLGYISDTPTKLSDIWPIMNMITFQMPVYSDTSSSTTIGQIPNNALWKPGKYVSIGTPRQAYLEDALAENLGFVGGYYFSLLSPFGAAGNIFQGGTKLIAESNGKTISDYWLKMLYDPSGGALQTPWQLINNYFNKFVVDSSNKALNKIAMYSDHGIYNYNISGAFTSAILETIYKQKNPGFTGTYFDILKKEILDPLGSNMFYYMNDASDSRFARCVTTWTQSRTNGAIDGSGWVVDNSLVNGSTVGTTLVPLDITTSPAQGNVNAAHAALWTNFMNDSTPPKLFLGNFGLIGTMADYAAFAKIFLTDGVLPNGKRLISANNLELLKQSRLTPTSYAASPVAIYVLKNLSNYGLGCFVRGPSYNPMQASSNNDPTWVYGNTNPASFVPPYGPVYGNLACAPYDELGWFGAAGTGFQICREKKSVFMVAFQDASQSPDVILVDAAFEISENEYSGESNDIYIAP
jgi:hypothetical protein